MSLFKSFFMGGYECADHINRSGERVNLLKETEHDLRCGKDYKDIASLGILVAREGICWSSVETAPFVFDFTEVKNRILAAEENGIQVIWDLCHFGYPDNIYPTHPHFCQRFVSLCSAFAEFYAKTATQPLFVVPVNEISFLSWHSGDVRGTVPFAVNCGFDIKYHLCKAAIEGIKMLKLVSPDCRIILVEPLISIHGRLEDDPLHIGNLNEHQFQAMDIIAGRMCPELGGREEFLDILGFNYYWNSQWENGTGALPWPEEYKKRTKVASLLKMAYLRYLKPIFLSETGHFGVGRAQWIEEITEECIIALSEGLPILGACIYPVTDRPDWDDLSSYSNCGIYELDKDKNRFADISTVEAVLNGHAAIERTLAYNKFVLEIDELSSTLNIVIRDRYLK